MSENQVLSGLPKGLIQRVAVLKFEDNLFRNIKVMTCNGNNTARNVRNSSTCQAKNKNKLASV